MSLIGRIDAAPPAASLAACEHCAAPLSPGQARFCCAGCEGAHDLVQGLGLDLYYRRREGAAGALRPVDPPSISLAARCESPRTGEQRIDLILGGLSCGACVWLVEQALAAEPDVIAARVSLTARRLTLRWRGGPERADDFANMLARLGFRVAPWSPACLRVAEDAEGRRLLRALGIAAFGSMNVMLVSVAV
ncbi:MAG: cation transporter, partial [Pseudomonadota bacterium]